MSPPEHHRRTAIGHYAEVDISLDEIDISLEQSSVCVVDATGRVVRDAKVASGPEALNA